MRAAASSGTGSEPGDTASVLFARASAETRSRKAWRSSGPADVQAFRSFFKGLGFSFFDMTGFLLVSVHSPSGDPAREKNLLLHDFLRRMKFGFGNSGIGVEGVPFGAFVL